MAVFTANAAQTTAMPKGNRTGLVAVTSFWSWDRSVSVGTTIQMVKVPAGGTPLFVQVGSNNAGQSSVSVGDGVNNSRYLNNLPLSSWNYSRKLQNYIRQGNTRKQKRNMICFSLRIQTMLG